MTESEVFSGAGARRSMDFHLFSISKTDRRATENKAERPRLQVVIIDGGYWQKDSLKQKKRSRNDLMSPPRLFGFMRQSNNDGIDLETSFSQKL